METEVKREATDTCMWVGSIQCWENLFKRTVYLFSFGLKKYYCYARSVKI